MKVVQINSVVNKGSTGHIVEDIGKLLKIENNEAHVFYGRNSNKSDLQVHRIGNNLTVFFHYIISAIFDLHGKGSYFATKKMVKKLDEINPDIVHLHNIHGYYLNIDLLLKWLAKKNIPVVWTLHDCWLYTGHCAYYSFIGCDKWKNEKCKNCNNKKTYPKSYLFSNSYKNFCKKEQLITKIPNITFVTPSLWLKNELNMSYLKEYPCEVINNGIDLDLFTISDYTETPKSYILGCASIWEDRKGLKDFFKLSKIIDDKYLIVIIGLSEKQLKGLPENIKGIGRTESQKELADWYSKSLVFFNPTYEDNFPTTNIESLACGTPVITYDTGGSPEILDENTGYVVEKGNIQSVYECIKNIQKNGKKYYNENCLNRAKKFYDKEERYKDYIELYKSLLH